MMRKKGYRPEDIEQIKNTALALAQYDTQFYTGHCTGEQPYEIMKEILGERAGYLHSGDAVDLHSSQP